MDIVSEAVVEEGAPSSNATNPITDPKPEPIGTKQEVATEETPPAEKVDDPIPKGVQKRIDRAVRQKYEAEARAKMLEERVAAMEARQSAPQQQRQQDSGEPTIDKFDNFDEYVRAVADYRAEKKIEATLTEREKRQSAEREAAERKKTADSWQKRMAAATVEIPDFEEVLASSDVPMTPPMQQAIMESDLGPKLAYHLATNPEEAEKIARMTPIGAVRALTLIEEGFKKPVAVSKATPPITPVGSKATSIKSLLDTKDYDEFSKRREAQIAKRR